MLESPAKPTALPGVASPAPRVPEEMRILGEGAAPLALLTATAGSVLALLPPPWSTGKMMLQRRDLGMMGSGALLGQGHSLAAGHRIGDQSHPGDILEDAGVWGDDSCKYGCIYICATGKPGHGAGIAAQVDSLLSVMRLLLTNPP